jgi:membrane protein involved in colicin uptake
VTLANPAAKLSAELRSDFNTGDLAVNGSVTYAAGDAAMAGSEPTLRFSLEGRPATARLVFDSEPLAQFLTQRALEREQARVEAMQAVLIEKQRLRREVRYYAALQAERGRLAAEALRKAEEEARRRAEIEASRKAEEEERKRIAAEQASRKAEEEARAAEEARLRAEEEEFKRIAAEEAKRKADEARAVEEARIRAEEDEFKRIAAEEAKRKADENAPRRVEPDATPQARPEAPKPSAIDNFIKSLTGS